VLGCDMNETRAGWRVQGFYNADRPKDTAQWQLRFQLQFLLPK
jgi:hypothetical protein